MHSHETHVFARVSWKERKVGKLKVEKSGVGKFVFKLENTIPMVKLKIPGKSFFETRIPNFYYSYLPVAAVGT